MKHQALVAVAVGLAAMTIVQCVQLGLPKRFTVMENSDYTLFYEPVGRSIAEGAGVTVNGSPATRYPPGYPGFVACGILASRWLGLSEPLVLHLLHLAANGAAAGLLYLLALQFWPSSLAVLLCGAWLTYPFTLWLFRQPASETPFFAAYFLALFLAARVFVRSADAGRSRLLLTSATGFAAGLAALVRPAAIGLGIVLAALLWAAMTRTGRAGRTTVATGILAGYLLAVTPWIVTARLVTGLWLPLGSGGVPSIVDGLTFAVNPGIDYRAGVEVPDGVLGPMRYFEARRYTITTVGGLARGLLEVLREDPAGCLHLFALKLARCWYATDSGRYDRYALLIQGVYLAAFAAAAVVAWRRGGALQVLLVVVLSLLAYFYAMALLVISIVRYMMPALAPAFLLLPCLLPVGRSTDPRPFVEAFRPRTHETG